MAKTFIRARWLLVGLLLLTFWLTPVTTHGQSRELVQAYERAKALSGQGRYLEAVPFALNAVRFGEREYGSDHPTFAIFLNNLGLLYVNQGRYAEAEPLYKRALTILEKTLGTEHPNVASALENYADLLVATGRSAEAEELEARAAGIRARRH